MIDSISADHFYIGDPVASISTYTTQDFTDNCAVAAQLNIIRQYGIDLSLGEANYVAEANGWYVPGYGTSWDNTGNLLDHYGIDYHKVEHASIQQLAQELQLGNNVIVGVRSADLWDQGFLADFQNWITKNLGLDAAPFNPADHAVVVTGIDVSDPSNPQVIINDPGMPNGAAMHYPLEKFMDAWENHNFSYVATNHAPDVSGLGRMNVGGFDIGEFLGVGTTLVVVSGTGDWVTATAAGTLVTTLVNNVNRDAVLQSV